MMNKGVVYALWGYEAQNSDELSFREGDAITILRRKDEHETEWWWARLGDREGYVPRNLLGVSAQLRRAGARIRCPAPGTAWLVLLGPAGRHCPPCSAPLQAALWPALGEARPSPAARCPLLVGNFRGHPVSPQSEPCLLGSGRGSLRVAVRGPRTGWRWGWVRVLRVSAGPPGRLTGAGPDAVSFQLCPRIKPRQRTLA